MTSLTPPEWLQTLVCNLTGTVIAVEPVQALTQALEGEAEAAIALWLWCGQLNTDRTEMVQMWYLVTLAGSLVALSPIELPAGLIHNP